MKIPLGGHATTMAHRMLAHVAAAVILRMIYGRCNGFIGLPLLQRQHPHRNAYHIKIIMTMTSCCNNYNDSAHRYLCNCRVVLENDRQLHKGALHCTTFGSTSEKLRHCQDVRGDCRQQCQTDPTYPTSQRPAATSFKGM